MEVQNKFAGLYQYFTNYWLNEVEPESFSVNKHQERSNNAAESWNRWFNARCVTAHKNISYFIGKFLFQLFNFNAHTRAQAN